MISEIVNRKNEGFDGSLVSSSTFTLAPLAPNAQVLALRMFTNPYLLEQQERKDLVSSLREAVAANPRLSDLRVVLGMALCVSFEVEGAIDELQESVRLAPDSFIANLKLGELWMRLRVCPKAEKYTREAALLARNRVQAELARKQAATLRSMAREGIERGGPGPAWSLFARLRKLWRREQPSVALEPTS